MQWALGALSTGVKWQGRESDLSPPSIAEVKNGEAIPTLRICLHGIMLNELSTEATLPLTVVY
jgi:hypothetical protein